ncbi:MAG: polyprenyl diphosphate synthase [Kiloniellales bacterium]|nr:polyprenyl diphosphate synthase [Kiloniellales bacterium]MDJ0972132.1 polyprenyl diphosphate synthase [Kiloniellales bacterium]
MDGNGRWANARGLPRAAGHQRGAEAARRAVMGALSMGVSYLTLYGFSAENWKRPATEVDDLMGLLRWYLHSQIVEMVKEGIRLRVIGDRTRLSKDLIDLIDEAEGVTADNRRLNLTIAISYGGRQEIVAATRRLVQQALDGSLAPADIDEHTFEAELDTADLPDPDLILRTSGEQRISNFLIWQSAYSELVFVDKLWPDFGEADLAAAIQEFQSRDRRYGAANG